MRSEKITKTVKTINITTTTTTFTGMSHAEVIGNKLVLTHNEQDAEGNNIHKHVGIYTVPTSVLRMIGGSVGETINTRNIENVERAEKSLAEAIVDRHNLASIKSKKTLLLFAQIWIHVAANGGSLADIVTVFNKVRGKRISKSTAYIYCSKIRATCEMPELSRSKNGW